MMSWGLIGATSQQDTAQVAGLVHVGRLKSWAGVPTGKDARAIVGSVDR